MTAYLQKLSVVVISLGLLILLGLYCGHILSSARNMAQRASCLSNVKELSAAISLYTQDWDAQLPPAMHWGDCIMTSIKHNQSLFHCPASKSPYGYAFNRVCNGLLLKKINDPGQIVVLFEADATTYNKAGAIDALTSEQRQAGRLNFGFADGHAKSVMRRNASNLHWQP